MDDYLTSENVAEDNLKSEDIRALENKLQDHSDIVYIPFLYEWLMRKCECLQKWHFHASGRKRYG